MEESLKQRKWGDAVRLEIETGPNNEKFNKILNIIVDEIEIDDQQIFKTNGVIDFTFLNKLGSLNGFDDLKYEKVKVDNIKKFWLSFTTWFEDELPGTGILKAYYEDYDNWNGGIYYLGIDFE